MNLSHRLLQLGKTASNKIDQALPGFGFVGLIYLAGDIVLDADGLGSPLKHNFWHQYGAELANGNLLRYSGTIYTAAATTAIVLGIVGEHFESAKEYSQIALGTLAGIGSGVFLADAIKGGHLFTIASAGILIAANLLLVAGTETCRSVVEPVVEKIKKRFSSFSVADTMAGAFIFGSLPMAADAWKEWDIYKGAVVGLWTTAALISRHKMKQQQVSNPAITH